MNEENSYDLGFETITRNCPGAETGQKWTKIAFFMKKLVLDINELQNQDALSQVESSRQKTAKRLFFLCRDDSTYFFGLENNSYLW